MQPCTHPTHTHTHTRAHTHTQVEYFGAPTPLKQVVSISVPEASTLVLVPFEKSILKDVERAINVSSFVCT